MEIDRASVDHVLTTTRAVRRRLDLDRPVPRELIEECLDIAIQAPTGSNAQGWRWLVLTDDEPKKAAAEAYRTSWAGYPKPTDADTAQQKRVWRSANYLAEILDRVPVHVIPCLMGKIPQTMGHSAMWAGFLGSIFPAVWNFQLALRTRGLGSVLTTLHLPNSADFAKLVGIPEQVTQCALIPVAYTKGTDFKPATRVPASDLTHWNRWA